MRKLLVVLTFIAAALALILATTPFLQTAYFAVIAAVIFGFFAFYLSKQNDASKKSIQLVFLLTAIALALTTYKTIFKSPENEEPENIERNEASESKDNKADFEINEMEPAPQLEGMEDQ